jgi:hypothetical protein
MISSNVRMYVWIPSDQCLDFVTEQLPFGSLQFIITELENDLLDLDDGKGLGPDGVPSLVFKSCTCAFTLLLSMSLNRFVVTFILPDAWKLSFVTPIFKRFRQIDVVNYRGIAVLSVFPKLFELLVYKDMY